MARESLLLSFSVFGKDMDDRFGMDQVGAALQESERIMMNSPLAFSRNDHLARNDVALLQTGTNALAANSSALLAGSLPNEDLGLQSESLRSTSGMVLENERQDGANGMSNTMLFDQYAARFGINSKMPSTGMETGNSTVSVEGYAAMLGIKLEQKQDTSMTMPNPMMDNGFDTGVYGMNLGSGLNPPMNPPLSSPMNPSMSSSINAPMSSSMNPPMNPPMNPSMNISMNPPMLSEKNRSLSTPITGSQTLDPELLQTMIDNNVKNAPFVVGNESWQSGTFIVCLIVIQVDVDRTKGVSKADKSRERNRDHSRKSRLRKKVFVENLKQEVKELRVYKQICEQCLDMIAVVSCDTRATITFANSSYTRLLGISIEHIMEQHISFYDLIQVEDRHVAKNALSSIQTRGEHHGCTLMYLYNFTDVVCSFLSDGIFQWKSASCHHHCQNHRWWHYLYHASRQS